ncbi:hypothetical protein Hamer_G031637, partial [Homarus americanus]
GYDSLRFPRCLLSDLELGVLASQLRRRHVPATRLVVPGDKHETFTLSGYTVERYVLCTVVQRGDVTVFSKISSNSGIWQETSE